MRPTSTWCGPRRACADAPDKERFFADAARVLKPGGRVVIAEYLRAARPLDARNETLLTRWLSGWAIPDLLTADEMRAGLADAGFDDIEIRDLTAEVRPSLRRLHRYAAILRRVDRAAAGDPRTRPRADRQQHRRTQPMAAALQRGAWTYGVITARKPG